MLDRYLWGRVSRISPEAPVPVVKVESRTYRLGGAANVAANLAALGCRVRLVGAKGAEASGKAFRSFWLKTKLKIISLLFPHRTQRLSKRGSCHRDSSF